MAHEFGHAIGLTHSTQCGDVMTLAADCPGVPDDQLPQVPTTHDLERCQAVYGGTSPRSEEHTSELQSLMRISYAVFCLKKKNYIYPVRCRCRVYLTLIRHKSS